mgnify:CR=1 FL=1
MSRQVTSISPSTRPPPKFPFVIVLGALSVLGALGPLAAIEMGQDTFLSQRFNIAGIGTAAALSLAFSAVVAVSYGLAQPVRLSLAQLPEIDRSVYVWFGLVAMSIAFIGQSPGEIANNIVVLSRKTRGALEGQSWLYAILTLAVFQVSFVAAAAERLKSNKAYYTLAIVAIATAALCFACGSRARALLAVVIPLLYVGVARRASILPMFLMGSLAIPLVYIGDLVRRTAQGRAANQGGGPILTLLDAYSLADPMAVSMYLSERAPVGALEAIRASFAWFLPSSWVGEKDWVGSITARYYLYGDTISGITLSSAGEAYYYFGAIGFFIAAAIIGAGLKTISPRYDGTMISAASHAALCMFLFSSLRNGLLIDLLNYVILAGALGLNIALARRRG